MRALAVVLVFVPSVVFAQAAIAPAPAPAPAPEPSECVTTTTVRCTGAAAPYAAQPAPPGMVVVPTPPLPPPMIAPRPLGDGWRLVKAPDGSLWRERKVSTDAPSVWGTGLGLWLGSYFIGASVAQARGNPLLWWPVIGAFWTSGFTRGQDQVLSAIDGVVQAGGFVAFLVGLAAGPDRVERLPLMITPMSSAGGGGLAITGRF